MANNYCEFSSFLTVPKSLETPEGIKTLKIFLNECRKELEETGGFCGTEFKIINDSEYFGIWFYVNESGSPEHVAFIAEKLVDEFEIDEPFASSWSYTCSKPRIDEFGGGAFVVKRGQDTYWVDAMNHVMEYIENGYVG